MSKEHKYNEIANVPEDILKAFEDFNEDQRRKYKALWEVGALTDEMPVGAIQFIHISKVQANDYNPNSVAHHEMKLLHTSIAEDGYTQPTVTIWDEDLQKYVIVDGFHRYTTMRVYEDIAARSYGHLPIVVIDKPIQDRIASTVRHNRARGKHSMDGMSNLVFQMLQAGEDDVTICNKLGLEPSELARLKHITGYSKLYKDVEFSTVAMTKTQMRAKAQYRKDHPDERVPQF